MEKMLGALEMTLEERKEKNEKFSRERKLHTHSRHLLKDPNGQIVYNCLVKL